MASLVRRLLWQSIRGFASSGESSSTLRPFQAVLSANSLDQTTNYYSQHFKLSELSRGSWGGQPWACVGPAGGSSAFSLAVRQAPPQQQPVDLGEGFGHFGLAVKDCYAAVGAMKQGGAKVTRDAGPVKGGTNVIAFVEDPSGYKFEILHRPNGVGPEPVCQVMVRVGDLQRSIDWYSSVLGMRLLRQRDAPEHKYTVAFMGYGEEEQSMVVELTYNYGRASYRLSPSGYSHLVLAGSAKDVARVRAQAGAAAAGPGTKLPVFLSSGVKELGAGEGAAVLKDPSGYSVLCVIRDAL